jgi:hypothetical protein
LKKALEYARRNELNGFIRVRLMDEFTKKRILKLEKALQSKGVECELLNVKNLLLEANKDIMVKGITLLKEHLKELQKEIKNMHLGESTIIPSDINENN